jgi:UDP-glucose 4-epimerase
MRVLVTGGAGFIGSHVADRLLEDGHEVLIIDNESTGRPENVPEMAEYIRGDVVRAEDLELAFATGLDAVCHIAGQVSMIGSFSDPFTDLRTNTQGTVSVLQQCMRHRVPRLLYASSMTVYGETEVLPTAEETPCSPSSYYAITKYAAERYVHATAQRPDLTFDFSVTTLRMYTVYGPRQALDNPYQGVLGIFIGNLLRGEPITVFGDGEQTRDFVYVSDIVDAWALSLGSPTTRGQVFNLGSGRQISVNQLVDAVLASFGRTREDYDIQYRPKRPGEQARVEADVARASTALRWRPGVAFEDGLAETVRWAREEHTAANRRPTLTAS